MEDVEVVGLSLDKFAYGIHSRCHLEDLNVVTCSFSLVMIFPYYNLLSLTRLASAISNQLTFDTFFQHWVMQVQTLELEAEVAKLKETNQELQRKQVCNVGIHTDDLS